MERARDSFLSDTRLNRTSSNPQTVVYVSLIAFGLVTMTMSARAMLQACNAKERKSSRGSRKCQNEITRSSSSSSDSRFKARISSDPGPLGHQVSPLSQYGINAGHVGRERPQILRQNSYPGPSKSENEVDGDEAELLAKLVQQEEERWMHCSDLLRSSSKSMVAPSVALEKVN